MARSDLALRRVRRAYETTHVLAALRGIAIAVGVTIAAAALHRTTSASWLVAAALVAALVALAWRGGSWRRGAFAGVVAGLPPLIVPSLVIALSTTTTHCGDCTPTSMLWCTLSCFGASSIVGAFVGHRATVDRSPLRYALAALPTAALTGLLGCGTIGLGGAVGVVIGLIAGAVTGWVVGGRTAHV